MIPTVSGEKFTFVFLSLGIAGLLLLKAAHVGAEEPPQLVVQSSHTDAVTALAFTSDGEQMASGSRDHTVRLWEVKRGYLVRTLAGHYNGILTIRYTSDGRRLVSASSDATVKQWEPNTGKL